MTIASNTGYATIIVRIAKPLDDEISTRLVIYNMIKKRKIVLAITVAINCILLK